MVGVNRRGEQVSVEPTPLRRVTPIHGSRADIWTVMIKGARGASYSVESIAEAVGFTESQIKYWAAKPLPDNPTFARLFPPPEDDGDDDPVR